MTRRDFDPEQVERLLAIVGVMLVTAVSVALPLLASAR